jgi:hypothetical protein
MFNYAKNVAGIIKNSCVDGHICSTGKKSEKNIKYRPTGYK